jgi:hypothetical protein
MPARWGIARADCPNLSQCGGNACLPSQGARGRSRARRCAPGASADKRPGASAWGRARAGRALSTGRRSRSPLDRCRALPRRRNTVARRPRGQRVPDRCLETRARAPGSSRVSPSSTSAVNAGHSRIVVRTLPYRRAHGQCATSSRHALGVTPDVARRVAVLACKADASLQPQPLRRCFRLQMRVSL